VSNPAAPVGLGSFQTVAMDIEVQDNLVYVTCQGEGLRILDVSDPSSPSEVGAIRTSGEAVGVAMANGIAYVAARSGGLRAFNVSDPAHPVEEGFISSTRMCGTWR